MSVMTASRVASPRPEVDSAPSGLAPRAAATGEAP